MNGYDVATEQYAVEVAALRAELAEVKAERDEWQNDNAKETRRRMEAEAERDRERERWLILSARLIDVEAELVEWVQEHVEELEGSWMWMVDEALDAFRAAQQETPR